MVALLALRIEIGSEQLVELFLAAGKILAQCVFAFELPGLLNQKLNAVDCAAQRMASSQYLIQCGLFVAFGLLAIEVAWVAIDKGIARKSAPRAHPLALEFAVRSVLSCFVVIRGLYNPYFALLGLACLVMGSPLSWAVKRPLRIAYAIILIGLMVQVLRQAPSLGDGLEQVMIEASCTRQSNWYYFLSFVVLGNILGAVQWLKR